MLFAKENQMIKKCPTCGTKFVPSGAQIYCRSACYRKPSPEKKLIERYEREVVDAMTLVQLERKKLDEMKLYRMQYNRIKDYINNSVEPCIDDLKDFCTL